MQRPKAHKVSDKNSRANGEKKKRQEETICALISGLDELAAQATVADMGTASRIFFTAKEELVHWAATMNFYESSQDRFINQHLYDARLSTVGDFINRVRAVKDPKTRSEILGLLGMRG